MNATDRLAAAYVKIRQLLDLMEECPVFSKSGITNREKRMNAAATELAEAIAEVTDT